MAAGMNFTARSLSNAALSSKSSHFSVTTKLFLQHHKTPYCCWSVDTLSTIRASRRAQVNLHRNMSVVWKIEFVGQQRTTVKLTRVTTVLMKLLASRIRKFMLMYAFVHKTQLCLRLSAHAISMPTNWNWVTTDRGDSVYVTNSLFSLITVIFVFCFFLQLFCYHVRCKAVYITNENSSSIVVAIL